MAITAVYEMRAKTFVPKKTNLGDSIDRFSRDKKGESPLGALPLKKILEVTLSLLRGRPGDLEPEAIAPTLEP